MNITARDLLVPAVSALISAAFVYFTSVGSDFLFGTRLDASMQRTAIANKAGILFQLSNSTSSEFENIKISITHPVKVESVSADNAVTANFQSSTDFTTIILNGPATTSSNKCLHRD